MALYSCQHSCNQDGCMKGSSSKRFRQLKTSGIFWLAPLNQSFQPQPVHRVAQSASLGVPSAWSVTATSSKQCKAWLHPKAMTSLLCTLLYILRAMQSLSSHGKAARVREQSMGAPQYATEGYICTWPSHSRALFDLNRHSTSIQVLIEAADKCTGMQGDRPYPDDPSLPPTGPDGERGLLSNIVGGLAGGPGGGQYPGAHGGGGYPPQVLSAHTDVQQAKASYVRLALSAPNFSFFGPSAAVASTAHAGTLRPSCL